MENERLLSEQEISKALTVSAEFVSENAWSFGSLTIAQDAKTTAALIEWLEGECEEHPHIELAYIQNEGAMRAMELLPEHRYLCPDCMKQIKQEIGIQEVTE